jgi:CDGSH-type Zn-finger protein
VTVRLRARPRGPLVVELEGDEPLEVFRADGSRVELSGQRKLRLCRCGASAYAPLCDGSHDRVGFEAPVCEELQSAEEAGE